VILIVNEKFLRDIDEHIYAQRPIERSSVRIDPNQTFALICVDQSKLPASLMSDSSFSCISFEFKVVFLLSFFLSFFFFKIFFHKNNYFSFSFS